MWDAIARVLTNSNALLVLIFLFMFVLILIILAMSGLVRIDTGSFKMGADIKERDIIRQQVEWSHSFIIGLRTQIVADESEYHGFLTLFVLETIHNEVVNWITFNHINLESDYISIKQEKVKSILRTMPIKDEYHSKAFEAKVDKWVEEIIRKLVVIRKVYK